MDRIRNGQVEVEQFGEKGGEARLGRFGRV